MNALNRLTIRSFFCVFLALALSTNLAQGQTPRPRPQIPIPPVAILGKPHHIVGEVEKGNWQEGCPGSLTGARLQVVEFWYMLTADEKLVKPDGALSFMTRPLEQGRVLGEVRLTGEKAFDVQWSEQTSLTRVPWAKNVQNGTTGEIITVYRLLSLKVIMDPQSASGAFFDPVPFVMFSGTETSKNVGTIRVNCIFLSG